MRNLSLTISLLLGLAVGCLGQAVRMAPSIAVTEAEYRDAVHAWLHADPDLAKDLLKAPPEEVRGRVHHVAALGDEAMVKQRSYLAAIAERMRRVQQQLTTRAPERIPANEIKRSLPEQQADVEGRRENVEVALRELPPGEEYRALRRHLEGERDRLEALHNDLAARYSALDALDRAQDGVDFAELAGLAARLEDVARSYERERDDVEHRRADLRDMYGAMERAVDANAGVGQAAPGPAAAGKKKAKPTRKGKDKTRSAGPGR